MIKILIADDQALFLDMLCTIIATYEGYEVVARACNGRDAVTQYTAHHPDLCLLDIQMPVSGGIDALKNIKSLDNAAKVIMLTTFNDDINIIEAYNNDADGYILKDVRPDALINAIKCVYSGLVCMNKSVLSIIHKKLPITAQQDTTLNNNYRDLKFDPIDMEIIKLIGSGMTNRQISEILSYSEGTIRNHISSILFETGLRDRTQIALFAIKNSLV